MRNECLGASVVIGDFTLTPVERTEIRAQALGGNVTARGEKRVVAVIVRRGQREWRLDLPEAAATTDRASSTPD